MSLICLGALLIVVVEFVLQTLSASGAVSVTYSDRFLIYGISLNVIPPLYFLHRRERAATLRQVPTRPPPGAVPPGALPVLLPDNVTVYFRPASVMDRVVAALGDGAIILGTLGLYYSVVFVVGMISGRHVTDRCALLAVETGALLIPLIYFLVCEIVTDGQTPGKKFRRLRVIHETGRSLQVPEIYIRNVLKILPLMIVFIPIEVVCLRSGNWRQRLGDIAAGSVVVQEPS